MTKSMVMRKRTGERMQPCLTPVLMSNISALDHVKFQHFPERLTVDAVKSFLEIDEVDYQGCLVFKALFNYSHQGSLQDRPFRKPARSSLSLLSTCSLSGFSRTEQNTFPGMECSVVPLQLLQSLRFPSSAVSR